MSTILLNQGRDGGKKENSLFSGSHEQVLRAGRFRSFIAGTSIQIDWYPSSNSSGQPAPLLAAVAITIAFLFPEYNLILGIPDPLEDFGIRDAWNHQFMIQALCIGSHTAVR